MLGRVRMPSQRAGWCREALLEVREGSEGNLGGPGGLRRPSRRSRRAWEVV